MNTLVPRAKGHNNNTTKVDEEMSDTEGELQSFVKKLAASVDAAQLIAGRTAITGLEEDDDDDEEGDEDDDEEDEAPAPEEAPASAKKRRRSNSSTETRVSKKKGRPPGSKNKKGTKASQVAGGNSGSEEKKKGGRDPYFKEEEDYYLCIAYANASEDPITGANQKGTSFWRDICTKFNDLAMEKLPEEHYVARTSDTLKNRFKRVISPTIMQYNKCWKEARTPPKSGWDATRYNDKAKKLYLAYFKKRFAHEKCLPVLHKMPKFNPDTMGQDSELEPPYASEAGSARASPVNNVGSVMGQNLDRPVGNKRAKYAKYKRNVATEALLEQVNVMKDLNKATYELSKTIRDKASQESDLNMAMLNHKLGKRQESEYHLQMAAARGERWRAREMKEHEVIEVVEEVCSTGAEQGEEEDDEEGEYWSV